MRKDLHPRSARHHRWGVAALHRLPHVAADQRQSRSAATDPPPGAGGGVDDRLPVVADYATDRPRAVTAQSTTTDLTDLFALSERSANAMDPSMITNNFFVGKTTTAPRPDRSDAPYHDHDEATL